jgi:hypothetical protein
LMGCSTVFSLVMKLIVAYRVGAVNSRMRIPR